jgi:hypothetical protein
MKSSKLMFWLSGFQLVFLVIEQLFLGGVSLFSSTMAIGTWLLTLAFLIDNLSE